MSTKRNINPLKNDIPAEPGVSYVSFINTKTEFIIHHAPGVVPTVKVPNDFVHACSQAVNWAIIARSIGARVRHVLVSNENCSGYVPDVDLEFETAPELLNCFYSVFQRNDCVACWYWDHYHQVFGVGGDQACEAVTKIINSWLDETCDQRSLMAEHLASERCVKGDELFGCHALPPPLSQDQIIKTIRAVHNDVCQEREP